MFSKLNIFLFILFKASLLHSYTFTQIISNKPHSPPQTITDQIMAEIGCSSFVTLGMEGQYKVEYIALWDTELLCSQYSEMVLSILFGHLGYSVHTENSHAMQSVCKAEIVGMIS